MVSSIKKWLINKLTSPLQNRIETSHDFQAELGTEHKNHIQKSYENPAANKNTMYSQPRKRTQQRASSASGPINRQSVNHNVKNNPSQTPKNLNRFNRDRSYNRMQIKKDYAPIAPHINNNYESTEHSFVDLNDIISDHIGTQFFNNVLGKSDSVQSISNIINKKQATPQKIKPNKKVDNINSLFSPTKPSAPKQQTKATNKYYYSQNKRIVQKSPECATLTPTTMTSIVDDTYEDSEKRDITLITLDRSGDSFVTDDFNTTTTDRKSTSTRILAHEVNLQTSFEELYSLADQFNKVNL